MLRTDSLHVSYGSIVALRGVEMHAGAGEIVGVIGANGAGKSTLLKAIAGFLAPTEGAVFLGDADVTGRTVEKRVRDGIALVPEGRQVWTELSVHEHLRLGCYARRGAGFAPEAQRLSEIYEMFPRLSERRRQRAGTLSGGEQQMLAIGRALVGDPSVLLLDEPCLGLAPLVIETIGEALRSSRTSDRAVIVAEQNAEFALDVCDRAYVLEVGEIQMESRVADLASHSGLVSAYLGTAPSP